MIAGWFNLASDLLRNPLREPADPRSSRPAVSSA